jgi:hypothetical protein
MEPRTPSIRSLALAGALLLLATSAGANELRAASSRVAGIVVHDAAETLRDYCQREDGRLWLVLPGGMRWELVTSTDDPAVANPGDGEFHAFEASEVAAALSEVRFPVAQMSAEVFLLPYPRRESLVSAAGPGLILLSPGVRPLSREHQHSEFVHELGHIVQYALLPDSDTEDWSRYMALRGLEPDLYTADGPHADRPHEIWAEDFRALFGGVAATSNGTIENPTLAYPTGVAGLDTFIQGLLAALPDMPATRLLAASVSHGAMSFSRFGTRASALDVFDASGRRLASLPPTVGAVAVSWTWDGTDRLGRVVRGEMVFARARDGLGGTVRVAVVR